ncbi:MAG: tol-pal system protein YbgF [Halothiobacillus sp. 20-53-49]|nr:tol-pal system protein YbgF [Halothiobacillaceae bacterium]OYV46049.1 MAG: tol-pal system protein YbgF [Halothiobacillus sp. 20-53-49]HUN00062.1 tol-pal system protein YbgF [Halothiobacillus sp.]
MKQLNSQLALHRIIASSLLSLAMAAAAQAQTPPNWLDWNGTAPKPAPVQEAIVATPLGAGVPPQPLGSTDAASNAPSSGQTVIIQNLLNNVSQLQTQVQNLRGQVEEQGNQIQRLQKSQQSGFSSLDDRLTKLEQPGTAAANGSSSNTPPEQMAPTATPAAPVAPTAAPQPAATAQPASSANDAKQQNLYNAAFTQLKNGSYDEAIKGFQATIDADPQGQWTPSALFWQGETYYVQQKRSQADAAYQKILSQFPQSDRVPDALLKTGYIAYDENKNTQARSIFQKVIAQFPQSQAANLAKQRLGRMDTEKR